MTHMNTAPPIEIDVRGYRGQEMFRRIRDVVSQYCGKELLANILTDDQPSLPQVKAFCAMSGCTYEVREKGGYWEVRVEGDACSCR